jgi:hypothetical protein
MRKRPAALHLGRIQRENVWFAADETLVDVDEVNRAQKSNQGFVEFFNVCAKSQMSTY